MNEDITKTSQTYDRDSDELDECDLGNAKPGRYRGVFQGRFIRILDDGTASPLLFSS